MKRKARPLCGDEQTRDSTKIEHRDTRNCTERVHRLQSPSCLVSLDSVRCTGNIFFPLAPNPPKAPASVTIRSPSRRRNRAIRNINRTFSVVLGLISWVTLNRFGTVPFVSLILLWRA